MRAETRAHDCIRQREQGRRSAALTAGSDDASRAADVEDLGEGGVESGVDPVGVEDPGEEGGVDPSRLSSRNGARRAQLEEKRATQTAPGGGARRLERAGGALKEARSCARLPGWELTSGQQWRWWLGSGSRPKPSLISC
jgi:hypothetical protein